LENLLALRTHGDFKMTTYKPSRLFVSEAQLSFNPEIETTPPLPIIDWSAVGQVTPKLLTSSGDTLPVADAVVITWADAEWAAMQHVFCASGSTMPYSARTKSWSGWTKYTKGFDSLQLGTDTGIRSADRSNMSLCLPS
jgi:hypothetical protein